MKDLYCITCPNGCQLKISGYVSDNSLRIEGNLCPRGIDFARAELSDPRRSLTTTVRTSFSGIPVLPVRTDGEIPKGKVMEAMSELNRIVIETELDVGDTVLENIVGSGINVIATSDLLSKMRLKPQVSTGSSSDFQSVLVTGVYDVGAHLGDYSDADDSDGPDDFASDDKQESNNQDPDSQPPNGRARITN